jgi:hypothetical protein
MKAKENNVTMYGLQGYRAKIIEMVERVNVPKQSPK